ncbi:hypothetical protein [Spirochaeta dissipatitropha]
MDNERKIIRRGADLFLEDVKGELSQREKQYDIAAEFAKTRKNRSYLVPMIILSSILFSLLLSVGVYLLIERNTARVQIQVGDFQDINLREVLDTVSRLESRLRRLQDARDRIESEYGRRQQDIRSRASREESLLLDRGLTQSQLNAERNQLAERQTQELAAVEQRFESEMAENQAEINEVLDLLAQYDTRQRDTAREQQAVLDSQSQLFELQLEELEAEYTARIENLERDYQERITELESHQDSLRSTLEQRIARERAELVRRYNPLLNQGAAAEIIGGDLPVTAAFASSDNFFPSYPVLEQEGIQESGEPERISSYLQELELLLARLDQIPYTNSVPDILAHITARSRYLSMSYQLTRERQAEVLSRRLVQIQEREEYIGRLMYAAEFFTRSSRENGYILNPLDPDQMIVYVDPERLARSTKRGYVFRTEDQLIAEIEIRTEGMRQYAEVISLTPGEHIEPFDTILLQLRDID